MKKIITTVFVSLGVIFSLILLFILYLFIFDPLNIKPLLFNSGTVSNTSQDIEQDTAGDETTGAKPFLSDEQKNTLESFGIDPASLPSSLTAEQEACFKTSLGEARFAEISAGASPSITEFMSARGCL